MRTTGLHDLITGAAVLAFGAAIAFITLDYPSTSGGFPFAIGAYMLAPLGGLLVLKGAVRLFPAGSQDIEDNTANQMVQFTPVTIGVIVAVCLATFAIIWLGFISSVALLAMATGVLFRMAIWKTAIYVAAQSVVLWGFLEFFNIQMPSGLLL